VTLNTLHIIQCYHYISSLTRKGYSEASQEKILKLLKRYYKTEICRRTLCYHLHELEEKEYIRRIRRHVRGPNGKPLFHTTIVILKRRALKFLARLAQWFRKVKWKVYRREEIDKVVDAVELQRKMIENARLLFGPT